MTSSVKNVSMTLSIVTIATMKEEMYGEFNLQTFPSHAKWDHDTFSNSLIIGHARYVWPRREGTGSITPSRGRVVTQSNT